jgi:hypothetical protein
MPSSQGALCEEFSAQKSVTEMEHPPYSPDFSSNVFRLFQKIKTALKGLNA